MKESFFQIDWFEFKNLLLAELDSKLGVPAMNSKNSVSFHRHTTAGGTWYGYTMETMQGWLRDGYMPDEVKSGLASIVPPTENRSTMDWNDDDGEFHLDLACSGADDYFSLPVSEKRAYGCRVEAGIMFSSATDSKVIRDYMIWIAKVLWTLESSGVNCSLLLDFPSVDCINDFKRGNPTLYHNLVQVKKEGEISDFRAWSAMVSPAALRNFGFALGDLHADSIDGKTSGTFGRGMRDRVSWKVRYVPERRVIAIENQYSAHGFPADSMDDQLVAALDLMRESQ